MRDINGITIDIFAKVALSSASHGLLIGTIERFLETEEVIIQVNRGIFTEQLIRPPHEVVVLT